MQVQINPGLADKVKETAKTVKGVEDSTAVVINGEISAAVKVKGFNRLRLKSIREEVHQKITELYKDYEVHVTSDKKLFTLLQQIEKQIKDQKVKSAADIEQRVKKINKDMQG
ncbi:MAG: YhcN/YlaJ family sporulation lipoprotein [Bacillota bacterium]